MPYFDISFLEVEKNFASYFAEGVYAQNQISSIF